MVDKKGKEKGGRANWPSPAPCLPLSAPGRGGGGEQFNLTLVEIANSKRRGAIKRKGGNHFGAGCSLFASLPARMGTDIWGGGEKFWDFPM